MIETLKFVRAAVCKAGHRPELMHFRIKGGTVQANNGHLAIQCPFPSDLDCCPHAGQFFKAIAACDGVISMHVDSGKLVVKSGKFKTHVHLCDPSKFPAFTPSGIRHPIPQAILPILQKLLPFVSNDENGKPWAKGVHFANNSAVATNSICIVEHWLPVAFPVIANIPRDAIAELVRLKLEPVSIQANSHFVTFHLPDDAWMSCVLMSYEWPNFQKIFVRAEEYAGDYLNAGQLESLLSDVAKLEGFTDNLKAVYFQNGTISTVGVGEGTTIDCPFAPPNGAFRADQLTALRGIVDRIGFNAYPAPVPFYGGDLLRGVMVGFQS